MEQLNNLTLRTLSADIATPKYDRDQLVPGIVHFGTGNFHRAHQAVYCDQLLNLGEHQWAIRGVSLRSSTMRDNLVSQDYLYTQPTLGETTEYRVIGSILDILVAPEDPQKVIDAVASPDIHLVTMTITEKGYCLEQGHINPAHPDIVQDLANLTSPRSIYGYLAASLIQRFKHNASPLTILCCDNINDGGHHLEQGVSLFLKAGFPEVSEWVAKHVAFCASMVDRVTPATDKSLKDQVAEKLGVMDSSPVAAEPFSQWIIQDKFAAKRPAFDKAGAMFVNDIAPFERVKLRFLNAAHSMLASLGYLMGDQYVHQALARQDLAQFTEKALKHDVLPIMHIPDGVDAIGYIDQVFARFHNANLPYACLQVGSDSSQKIQQRWLPSIDDALAQNKSPSYLAFVLAIWLVYIRRALENGDLNDPLKDKLAAHLSAPVEQDVQHFLALAGAQQFCYFENAEFMSKVKGYHQQTLEIGVERSVKAFLKSQ